MNKSLALFCCFFILSTVGCLPSKPKGKVAAKVGGYNLMLDDLKIELDRLPGLSSIDIQPVLDNMISEEVLIQEAQRQGIDRTDRFMKTIEQFWRYTLVKELMDKKQEEFEASLGAQTAQAALKEWVEELKGQTEIEIYDEILSQAKEGDLL